MVKLGVIYIGDRAVGKTHLAMELANPQNEYVKVDNHDYDFLKSILYDEDKGETRTTDGKQATYDRSLEIQVQLPTGSKQVTLDWVDTPGEIWRKSWQNNQPEGWRNFLETIRNSKGIMLVLPPYREIVKSEFDPETFITQQQWCNRFSRWVDFFRQDCPKIRHLILCLNKADLFCNLEQEASKLAYTPYRSQLNWQQRNAYVSQRYFRPIQQQIKQLDKSISGLSVRYFITSIHNRSLLELPWIYLGSYLAK